MSTSMPRPTLVHSPWLLALILLAEPGLAALGQEDPKQAELALATKLNAEGARLNNKAKYAEAEPLLKRALAIREKVLGPEHPDVGTSLNNLAELYRAQGRYREAEPLYRRDLAISEKALGPEHPDVAASLNNLGVLYMTQGRYGEAEPLYKRALAIKEKVLGPEDPRVATSLNNLAWLYNSQGKHAEAEPLNKRALAIWEKALGPEHPQVATCVNNLALLYWSQGKYGEAESLLKRALAISEKALGPEHPDVARGLNNLAALYNSQGKYREAELVYERALAIREKALGPEHSDVAGSLVNLAARYRDQGRYAEAEPLLKRALAILDKALGPEHPDVAAGLENLAWLYKSQRKYEEAEPLLKRAVAILDKALGPEHPSVATSLDNLGGLYHLQGKYGEAELLYRRALAIREKILGPEHPDVAMGLHNLAVNCTNLGDLGAAWEYGDRARRVLLRARRVASESPIARASFMGKYLGEDFVPCLALALGKRVDVLELAEQERALGLRELLAEARAQGTGRLPPEDQQKVASARGRINALNRQIEALAEKRLDTAAARQELLRAEMDYDAVMAELRKRHEQFVAIETASAVTSERLVRSEVLRDAAAVVGWVEYAKWAWGFVARKEGVYWEDLSKLSKPDELRGAFSRLAKGLAGGAPAEELAAGLAEICRCRFAPLERHLQGVRRVIVIAQGWAAVLPAETMLTAPPTKEQADPASWPWLANRYEISYAPSATALDILCRQRSARQRKGWERPLFALADPPFSAEQLAKMKSEPKPAPPAVADGQLLALERVVRFDNAAAPPRLPGTRREAETLARLFGADKSLLLLGPEASERRLFAASAAGELKKCRYVHLATHGLADGERPELSALVLARAPEDKDYDGLLQMREVFHLDLDADMVVLSACQTGRGEHLRGEGVVGLSTAFFFAGTPSLVMSLWNVPDVSTALLMRRFYGNLKAGQTKAAALREAKAWLRDLTRSDLAELNEKESGLGDLSRALGEIVRAPKGKLTGDHPFAHPRYWAGFILTGDPR